METELLLSIGGLPPQSARGCTQSLFPIENGCVKRTINGHLITTERAQQQKYATLITGKDQVAPAFENLWIGQEIAVSCIQNLWHRCSGEMVTLSRDPVEHSIQAIDSTQNPVAISRIQGREVHLLEWTDASSCYIGYRPLLDMKVTNFKVITEEWSMKVQWSLMLEEI